MNQKSVSIPGKGREHPVISALILAAGKGTRMKSELAKVLHPVYFKPMIQHVLDCVNGLDFDNIILITGHQAEAVEKACSDYPVFFVRQKEQLGTGHAVLTAESRVSQAGGVVMILCGDTPLISPGGIRKMLNEHLAGNRTLTVASTVLEDPANYGRLIIDSGNKVTAIVEEKDADPEQKKIRLVNAGIYCVDCNFLFKSLKEVGTDNKQGEVYLTDIVSLANKQGHSVSHFNYPDPLEVLGVNSRIELAEAHRFLQKRHLNRFMAEGVTVNLPDTVTIEPASHIGEDTVINPNVYICGETSIGRNCRIDSFVYIADSCIGDNAVIEAGTHLKGVNIEAGAAVKPAAGRRNDVAGC